MPESDLPGLVGQLIVGRFVGPRPSSAFLARIRAGQLGSVILFTDNTSDGAEATRKMVHGLQVAAHKGHNPPLLIMTDQEGGNVRRLPGPPVLAPANMSSDAIATAESFATGKLLRSVGINVDLAPVADIQQASGSFLGSRSFSSSPGLAAARACAFASGLATARIAYTLKHFPGLGRATVSTDAAAVSIGVSTAALRSDYAPYELCGAGPMALIMVSSASYPSMSGPLPAVMSQEIYRRELPIAVGRTVPLTISDDLQAPGVATQSTAAPRAIAAGLDLAMYSTTEGGSAEAYSKLLADARGEQYLSKRSGLPSRESRRSSRPSRDDPRNIALPNQHRLRKTPFASCPMRENTNEAAVQEPVLGCAKQQPRLCNVAKDTNHETAPWACRRA
jgi:beta-N-acetylhexosaminidase